MEVSIKLPIRNKWKKDKILKIEPVKDPQLKPLDLRNRLTTPKYNQRIIDLLESLIRRIELEALETDYYPLKRTHQFRALSIKRAIISIKNYPYPIQNYVQVQELRGIGTGICQRIDEIIQTGHLRELDFVPSPFVRAVESLCKVNGIGEDTAKKLVLDYKVMTINDLQGKISAGIINHGNLLNSQIQLGLRYFEDLQYKIPRQEILEISEYLRQIVYEVCPKLKMKICGSYRRKKSESRDIDILLVHPELQSNDDVIKSRRQYLQELLNRLFDENFLIDTMTASPTKFLGVAKWKDRARRVDILWVPQDSYYCSLLYFTGSDILNRMMRTIALRKGYSLNNYGLYPILEDCKFRRSGPGVDRTVNYKTILKDSKAPKQYVTGPKLAIQSERQVFEIIGIKYLRPEER